MANIEGTAARLVVAEYANDLREVLNKLRKLLKKPNPPSWRREN